MPPCSPARYRGTIYASDLQFDSPYNTYKFPGLPPGPIANPGVASLLAAMHPAHTEFLYFVSDNNGHHRFARDLQEACPQRGRLSPLRGGCPVGKL
jgi:UPF0755 protein